AAEAALSGGADEVIVADSHWGMRNLVPDLLPARTRLVSGNERPLGMMQGADEEGVAAVFLTGTHARSGSPRAVLAHTWNGHVHDLRLDGVSTGEYGLNAWVGAHFGVRAALVTGDDVAVAQVREELGEQVVGVSVKTCHGTYSASHLAPEEAVRRVREGAALAMRNLDSLRPYRLTSPREVRVEIDLDHVARVDLVASLVREVERTSNRTVAYTAPDAIEGLRVFRLVNKLAEVQQDV
ncbi:M55 family metallopeptidase, partial [Deinococcus pimensis]|uniref:M55 family metallopeptidase n=1 Tax=Deinococcus pimensis TaxID=309888 RepID=UPI00048098A8